MKILKENEFQKIFQNTKKDAEAKKMELLEYHKYLIDKNCSEEERAAQEEDLKDQIDYCLKLKNISYEDFLNDLEMRLKKSSPIKIEGGIDLSGAEFEPITDEDEVKSYIERSLKGDEAAQDRLICSFLRLALKKAIENRSRKFRRPKMGEEVHPSEEDGSEEKEEKDKKPKEIDYMYLFSAIYEELIETIKGKKKDGITPRLSNYDESKDGKFSTYIYVVITRTINREYRKEIKQDWYDAISIEITDEDGKTRYSTDPIQAREFVEDESRETLSLKREELMEVAAKRADEKYAMLFYEHIKAKGLDGKLVSEDEKIKLMKEFSQKVYKKEIKGLKEYLEQQGFSLADVRLFMDENAPATVHNQEKIRKAELDVKKELERVNKIVRRYQSVDCYYRMMNILKSVQNLEKYALMKEERKNIDIVHQKVLDNFDNLLCKFLGIDANAMEDEQNTNIRSEYKTKLEFYMNVKGYSFKQKRFGNLFRDGFLNTGSFPLRNEIIAIAFKEQLSEETLDNLLRMCGYPSLYVRQPYDLACKFALRRKWDLSQYLHLCDSIAKMNLDEQEKQQIKPEDKKKRYTLGSICNLLDMIEENEAEFKKEDSFTITERLSSELDIILANQEVTDADFVEYVKAYTKSFTKIRQRTYRVLMKALLDFLTENDANYHKDTSIELLTLPRTVVMKERTLNSAGFVRYLEDFCGVQFPPKIKKNYEKLFPNLLCYFEPNIRKASKGLYGFDLHRDVFLALLIVLKTYNQDESSRDEDALITELNKILDICGYETINTESEEGFDGIAARIANKGAKKKSDPDEDGEYIIFSKVLLSIEDSHKNSQYSYLMKY